MTKRNFETIVYSLLGIGAFLIEFLPVSIICFLLLSYKGIVIFFEIYDDTPAKAKGYYLKKGVFLFITLVSLCALLFIFMYRHKISMIGKT